jgi:hypothetical protein
MSEKRTVIIVGDIGAKYTQPGDKHDIIQEKAFAFRQTWDIFIREKNVTKLKKPSEVSDLAWLDLVDNLYKPNETNEGRVSILERIYRNNVNLLICTESELRESLETIFMAKEYSESYISKIVSNVRNAFKAIGREHKYGEGQVFNILNKPLINSNNPMTKGTSDLLSKLARENNSAKKHGAAAPMPLVYYYMLTFLLETLQMIGKISHVDRITNLAYLTLILAFLMHEGSRPLELLKYLHHRDLYFRAWGKTIPWLTFALVSPKTLAYLLENDILKCYTINMWKCKNAKEYRARQKSVIPTPYNSLDLFMIYTIVMRIIISIDPRSITTNVFKQGLNMAGLFARKLKNMDKFVLYSIRYGAAFDDEKHNIPSHWTRYRMAHSKKSNTKDKYAASNYAITTEQGVSIEMLPPMTSSEITLEFHEINGAETYEILTSIPKEIKDDIDMAMGLANTLIDPTQTYSHQKPSHELFSDLKELPFGTNIKTKLRSFETDLESVKSHLNMYFKPVQAAKVPEVWSYPYIMYGNWRSLLNLDSVFPLETSKQAPSKKSKKQNSDWEWMPAKIEPGNMVVLLSYIHDEYSLKLPNTDNGYVWVADTINYNKRKKEIRARFYHNEEQDITRPLTLDKKEIIVQITAAKDVLSIFETCEDLTGDDIEMIKTYYIKSKQ